MAVASSSHQRHKKSTSMYQALHVLLDWADSHTFEQPDWPLTLATSRALLVGWGKEADLPANVITWALGRKKYATGGEELARRAILSEEWGISDEHEHFLSTLSMALDNGATPRDIVNTEIGWRNMAYTLRKKMFLACLDAANEAAVDDLVGTKEAYTWQRIRYTNQCMMKYVEHGADPYILLETFLLEVVTLLTEFEEQDCLSDVVEGVRQPNVKFEVMVGFALSLVDHICSNDSKDKWSCSLLQSILKTVCSNRKTFVDRVLCHVFKNQKPKLDSKPYNNKNRDWRYIDLSRSGQFFHQIAMDGHQNNSLEYFFSKITLQEQRGTRQYTVRTEGNTWKLVLSQDTMTKLLSARNCDMYTPLDAYVGHRSYDNSVYLDWDVVIQFLFLRSEGLSEQMGLETRGRGFNFLFYMAARPLRTDQKERLRGLRRIFSTELMMTQGFSQASVLMNSHPENLAFFIEMGADPSILTTDDDENFIHKISRKGGTEDGIWHKVCCLLAVDPRRSENSSSGIVQQLLRQPNRTGEVPIAIWRCTHPYSISWLVDALKLFNGEGQDVSGFYHPRGECLRDSGGNTLCHTMATYMSLYKHEDIFIRDHNLHVTINAPNKTGIYPLWYMLTQGGSRPAVLKNVQVFMRLGADPLLKRKNTGDTIIHYIIENAKTYATALNSIQMLAEVFDCWNRMPSHGQRILELLTTKNKAGKLPMDLTKEKLECGKKNTNALKQLDKYLRECVAVKHFFH